MIIVGTAITSTKVKVDGSYIDGSQVITIGVTTPPNPPENQFGKDTVLFLNPETNELFFGFVDRPLTDTELLQTGQTNQMSRFEQMEADNIAFRDYVMATIGGV